MLPISVDKVLGEWKTEIAHSAECEDRGRLSVSNLCTSEEEQVSIRGSVEDTCIV